MRKSVKPNGAIARKAPLLDRPVGTKVTVTDAERTILTSLHQTVLRLRAAAYEEMRAKLVVLDAQVAPIEAEYRKHAADIAKAHGISTENGEAWHFTLETAAFERVT